MDSLEKSSDFDNVLQVVEVKDLPSYVVDFEHDLPLADMTSLGDLMLLGKNAGKECQSTKDDDEDLTRISLAYERLKAMPRILVEELGPTVQILDISNNEFSNLDFLIEFKQLTSLICDRNNITSQTRMPHMPKLELLWMNHCKIKEIHLWAKKLRLSCPNLRYLSLMGNPAAPSYLNGGNLYEYLQYRLFVISLFPKLSHFDDSAVTDRQRQEAEVEFHRQLVFPGRYLQEYFRDFSGKLSDFLTMRSCDEQRNVVI